MNNKLDYIAIDFETANTFKNSVCSVGLVRFIDGKETDSCYSLIHPAKMYFIPEWTEEIHGISYDDVRDKPYFPEVWDNLVMPFINKTLGIPLVAHNGHTFDMPVIRDCCNYFGMDLPSLSYIDSLLIARKTWPELESHRLTDLENSLELNIKLMMLWKIHELVDNLSNWQQINGMYLILKKSSQTAEVNFLIYSFRFYFL